MKVTEILLGGGGAAGRGGDLGFLAARLVFGLVLAFAHGVNKIPPSDRFVDVVGSLGFPLPAFFAWAAALAEFAGGILLAVGLLTRPAALMIVVTMLVAAFGRHAADPFTDKELALLYGAAAFLFALAGSGRFAADTWLRGLIGKTTAR